MKKIFFQILILHSFSIFGNPLDSSSFMQDKILKQEITNYINEEKPNILGKGKYFVPTLNFYQYESEDNFCFYLSYIMNEYDLDYISHSYFSIIENEIVLIEFHNGNPKNFVFKLESFDCIDKTLLLEKLYSAKKGGITGTHSALVFCKKGNDINKKKYENSDYVPNIELFYKNFPSNGTIKLIDYYKRGK